jgi:hypothetical protein
MWQSLINGVIGLVSGFYAYIITFVAALAIGGYFGYDFTADHFKAKIAQSSLAAEREKDAIQQKGDQLVAQYVSQLNVLSDNLASIQKQVPKAVQIIRTVQVPIDPTKPLSPSNAESVVVDDDRGCVVSNGFVRLFNASASGETSSPSSDDGTPSEVDTATLLSTIAENNIKYNKVAQQLRDLQAFEAAK